MEEYQVIYEYQKLIKVNFPLNSSNEWKNINGVWLGPVLPLGMANLLTALDAGAGATELGCQHRWGVTVTIKH